MSIESRSRQYGKVFDHWQIREFLGSGSGGKTAVFRLVRSDSDRGASALKVVNLIEERGSLEKLSARRREEYEAVRDECSTSAEQEVWMMDDLRGNTNIVDYLDHTFVDWEDDTGFGRDLLIRMELLKDLRSELRSGRRFSEAEVLKVGRDICVALILCHRKNILHRDVKPENIFLNRDGNYKLGDFGVSRVLDACPGAVASTGIGTYEYWPAEQMTGRYDTRVDTYSLGLVLYELSNQNRLPFAASSYTNSKEVVQRLSGAALPVPCDASPALAAVILKACAFSPEDRFASAEDMLRALRRVSSGRKPAAAGETQSTVPAASQPGQSSSLRQDTAEEPADKAPPRETGSGRKRKHFPMLPIGALLLAVGIGAAGWKMVSSLPGKTPDTPSTQAPAQLQTLPSVETQPSEPETTAVPETTLPEETTLPATTAPTETEPVETEQTQAAAEEAEKTVIGIVNSMDSGVNIRSGPGTTDTILGEYRCGTYVRILETTDVNGVAWGRTEDGWICLNLVYLLPERAEGEEKPIIGRVNSRSSYVNIRQKASSNSALLGNYPAGTMLEIWETSHVNGIQWGRTEDGWVCMTYVNMIPEQEEGSLPILYTGWVMQTSELNVRQTPSMMGDIAGKLLRGTNVNIYETSVADGKLWGLCDNGWIDLQYTDLLPMDLAYSDVRIVEEDNAPVYSQPDQLVRVASRRRLEMVLIYKYMDHEEETLCLTDQGWIPEKCFH